MNDGSPELKPIRRQRKPRPEKSGELNPASKLSELDVREIRGRADAGEAYASIAAIFDISPRQVSRIHRGKKWRIHTRE
jgi:hypothetical protein